MSTRATIAIGKRWHLYHDLAIEGEDSDVELSIENPEDFDVEPGEVMVRLPKDLADALTKVGRKLQPHDDLQRLRRTPDNQPICCERLMFFDSAKMKITCHLCGHILCAKVWVDAVETGEVDVGHYG